MDENVKQQVLAKKGKLIKTWKVKKKEKLRAKNRELKSNKRQKKATTYNDLGRRRSLLYMFCV